MYCFIPSWYSKLEPYIWHSNNRHWYYQEIHNEFDDTVNQIRLFLGAKEEVGLILLSYTPELCYFLHRQGIYPLPFWSAFDEMQGITEKEPGTLSYLDLEWPEGTEWVFTNFCVLAYVDNEKIARVQFEASGRMIWIDRYSQLTQTSRDLYDARGFLSSVIRYVDGSPQYHEYYDAEGALRFTHSFLTGEVLIAEEVQRQFSRNKYDRIEELIEEVLRKELLKRPSDTIVIASNKQHNGMIRHALSGQPIVFSFFEGRYDLEDREGLNMDIPFARLVVTDTEHTAKMIREAVGENVRIYDISPFDTRLTLGQSQRIRELKVLMPVDKFEGFLLERALSQVLDYLMENENVQLLIGTGYSGQERKNELTSMLGDVLRKKGLPRGLIEQQKDAALEETAIDEASKDQERSKKIAPRIFVVSYMSEDDLIQVLKDVRLILDVRDQPDLYLQIAGISAGIPQVNYRFTRYVQHQKAGFIIQNINHITEALVYYLSGLSHWNEALVYCVQEVEKYTSGSLVQQWKLAMTEV